MDFAATQLMNSLGNQKVVLLLMSRKFYNSLINFTRSLESISYCHL